MDSCIIVDSGSTKSDWLFLEGERMLLSVRLGGMNPHFTTPDEIRSEIERGVPMELRSRTWGGLFFYGSGCTPDKVEQLATTLQSLFICEHPGIDTDLVGAARAVCGATAGIACILGTGSAAGFYNGTTIMHRSPSLGYILGDEGSGAHFGRLLVNAVLKHQVPQLIETVFEQYVSQSIPLQANLETTLINRVYHAPFPNRFLASLSPFLHEHIREDWAHNLVLQAFRDFIVRNVHPLSIINYQLDSERPYVGFVGSIAYYYDSVLREAAALEGITISQIMKSPLEGLRQYHVH